MLFLLKMDLPSELIYKIISYTPQTEFLTVSKEWKGEINSILAKSVKTIEKWYKNKKPQNDYNTIQELVRYYVVHYPNEFFMVYPEFTIRKLNLNPNLLDVIPQPDIRKRSDVRDWMLNMPLSVNDWVYVGW